MTHEPSKPRRWTIFRDGEGQYEIDGPFTDSPVHVVEASVLDAAEREVEHLKEKLKGRTVDALKNVKEKILYSNKHIDFLAIDALLNEFDMVSERDALRSEVEELKADHAKWLKFDAFLKDDGDVSLNVYESAVKGRQEFRQALKEAREENAALKAKLEKATDAFEELYRSFAYEPVRTEIIGDKVFLDKESAALFEKRIRLIENILTQLISDGVKK